MSRDKGPSGKALHLQHSPGVQLLGYYCIMPLLEGREAEHNFKHGGYIGEKGLMDSEHHLVGSLDLS